MRALPPGSASRRVLDSSTIRFLYTGTFSNLAGGDETGGRIDAGVALRTMLLMVLGAGADVGVTIRG